MSGFTDLVWFIGVVENNVDMRLEGRVQVRAFGFHGTIDQVPTENLPWAIPIAGSYDPNHPVPPLNSWVFGFFLDGRDAQQPMLLGLLPTQYTVPVNPEELGYGRIDPIDYNVKAQGYRPQDIGNPQLSRLARGEDLNNTYMLDIEATKITDIQSASGQTWSEPGSAYNAKYPYNRVIETAAGHSIELDDTPGSERIMIYHNSGSYLQVDSSGTTTNKATNDKYDINENNMHVYVGGRCDVTIQGDAYVRVGGSKIEEVMGDMKTVVHGNYELNVGGYANFNVSDEYQMRGARVVMEANVEDVNIFAAKNFASAGGKGAYMASPEIVGIGGGSSISLKSPSISVQGGESTSISGEVVKIGAGGKVSIKGSVVAIDDVIQLANGESDDPDDAIEAVVASGAMMVEPVAKTISGVGGMGMAGRSSMGVSNAASVEGDAGFGDIVSDCSTDLVESIKSHETFSPNAYYDYKQYSIGYGTPASSKSESIDEEEATRRLMQRISSEREFVKQYGVRHGYNWNDCQIDALSSFRYNLGAGGFEQLTGGGRRDNNTIAQKMLEFNMAGGKVQSGLVIRRKSESDWFKSGSGIIDSNTSEEGIEV